MESISTSEHLNELADALAKAQGEMEPAKRSGMVSYVSRGSKITFNYATLDDLKYCSKKALSSNGLSIIQPVCCNGNGNTVIVATRLLHSSGQWIQNLFSITAIDSNPQSIGSATTYAKRYSYAAMLSIPDQQDDDGQAAAGIHGTKPSKIEAVKTHEQKIYEAKNPKAQQWLESNLAQKNISKDYWLEISNELDGKSVHNLPFILKKYIEKNGFDDAEIME